MSVGLQRRFWQRVSIVPQDTGFVLFLDQRPLRLPVGPVLLLPTARLAEAVAEEWRRAGGGNGGSFGPEQLVLTRLAGSLQERVTGNPAAVVDALMRHAEADLLCYRAGEPMRLAERQQVLWQPWLDWLHTQLGVRLRITAGVMPVAQEPAALQRLREVLLQLPPAILTGLGAMVPELGSLVLGLAVACGPLEAGRAVELARLDQAFQAQLWGSDAEGEAEAARLRVDVALTVEFMVLAQGPGDG